jgi:signal transduction histidine kinase
MLRAMSGVESPLATRAAILISVGVRASSRARIVAAADQTCRRIERDLHDGAQQRLANLVLQARMAREAAPETGELAARLDAVVEEATRAMAELRDLARGVHPADEAGLLDWSPAASSARGGRRFVRGRCCPVGGDAVGDVASVLVEEAE